MSLPITVIILTFNEAIHIERCIRSIQVLTHNIIVVDCYSTDSTLEIARSLGAKVLQHAWEGNQATQMNWALTQLPTSAQWVMRIDADEIISADLAKNINTCISAVPPQVNGISFYRTMVFQGKRIRFGGVGKNLVMRLFRFGFGQSESRWMDEHSRVLGNINHINGLLIDDNLQNLAWWMEKHRQYAAREAVDLLNLEYQFMKTNSVEPLQNPRSKINFKRWMKENAYTKLPGGIRAWAYFVLRYIAWGGFLDGIKGSRFHYLQALWYRSLADRNVAKVKRYMKDEQVGPETAILAILGIVV